MAKIAIVIRARSSYLKDLQDAFGRARDGDQIVILWPEGEPSDFPDESVKPTAPNIEVRRVPVPAPLFGKWSLPSIRLVNELRAMQPDLVWVHEFSLYTITALLFAKVWGIPVVVSSEVGLDNEGFFPKAVRGWHWFWGHFVDGVIACCPAARKPLCGVQLSVVEAYHAVDSNTFHAKAMPTESRAVPIFVFLGHLIPRKGVDLLLAAAQMLHRHGAEVSLRLIGSDGGGWAANMVRDMGLESCVEFCGFLSGQQLRDAMLSADVFVLPTRQDTYAAVVHEAACLGLPLLISKHAGACEALVREGVTGIGFLPEDTIDFAEKMVQLYDPGLREKMGIAARNLAEELSAHVRGPAVRQWIWDNWCL